MINSSARNKNFALSDARRRSRIEAIGLGLTACFAALLFCWLVAFPMLGIFYLLGWLK